MSELPRGWISCSLSQLVSKLVDGSHNPPSKQSDGLPMLSARNISNGKIFFDEFRLIEQEDFEREDKRTNIRPGDVLLTIVGTIGRSAIVPICTQKFTLQRSVAVIRPLNGIEPQYLKYVFDTPEFQQWLIDNAKGTAQKGIYLKKLASAKLPLPPLNEQHRIVAKLDKLFTRSRCVREELEPIPKLIKRYKQAVLSEAFRGDLTKEWREENQCSINDWKTYKIGDILNKIIGGGTPSKSKSEFWNGDIAWASVKDIKDGVYELKSTIDTITEIGLKNSSSNLIPKGTVIISTRMGLGRCCISGTNIAINQDLKALIPNNKMINTNYLLWLMVSLGEKIQVLGKGTTVKGITIDILKNLETLLPLALNEQQEIVKRIEKLFKAIDKVDQEYQKAIKLCTSLEQAALTKAFRGELVPQDPKDVDFRPKADPKGQQPDRVPAAVLLERILSEKQKQPTSKRVQSKY